MTSTPKGHRRSEARDRLLRTASALFYAKGINSVGVEEIVSEARVTRATFYRHFPSKDDLIVAYRKATDDNVRAQVHAITEHQQPPADTIRAIAAWIVGQINSSEFRGCAFLNAAAEYPDAGGRPNDDRHRHVSCEYDPRPLRGILLQRSVPRLPDEQDPSRRTNESNSPTTERES